jgi:hypothetical protein
VAPQAPQTPLAAFPWLVRKHQADAPRVAAMVAAVAPMAGENFKDHSLGACSPYPKVQKEGCTMTAKSEVGLVANGPKSGEWIQYGRYNPFNLRKVRGAVSDSRGVWQHTTAWV